MGGISKGEIKVNGRRLIDIIIENIYKSLGSSTPITVVHPTGIPGLTPEIKQVSEAPIYGGPVAGIGAACAEFATGKYIAICAVDAPYSPYLFPQLTALLESSETAEVAVVATPDPNSGESRINPLCAIWEYSALKKRLANLGELQNQAVFALLKKASKALFPGNGQEKDYDTLADLAVLGEVQLPGKYYCL